MKTDAVIASMPTMNDEKRRNLRANAERRLAKGPDAAAQTIIDALDQAGLYRERLPRS